VNRRLSLAPLTVPDLKPPEFIRCAAQAGFTDVALRLVQGDPRPGRVPALLHDAAQLHATRAALRDEGVCVTEIEVLVLTPEFYLDDCMQTLQTAAELGAQHLVVSAADADFARACAHFAQLCEGAAPFGLRVNIEFVPYATVTDLRQACAMVRTAATANAGILIDALHFERAGHRAADIASLSGDLFPSIFHYLQLCDGAVGRPDSMAEIMRQARQERLYPGAGKIDLAGILRALPTQLPISVEVPHRARIAQIGAVAHARRAREAVENLLLALEQ